MVFKFSNSVYFGMKNDLLEIDTFDVVAQVIVFALQAVPWISARN